MRTSAKIVRQKTLDFIRPFPCLGIVHSSMTSALGCMKTLRFHPQSYDKYSILANVLVKNVDVFALYLLFSNYTWFICQKLGFHQKKLHGVNMHLLKEGRFDFCCSIVGYDKESAYEKPTVSTCYPMVSKKKRKKITFFVLLSVVLSKFFFKFAVKIHY